jgi:hypothetical protein
MHDILAKIELPGVRVQLPSKGVEYTPDILDAVDGEVEIHPMTILDEINLKSPDALLNGTAATSVIQSCVPQVKNAAKLYAMDVEFLMLQIKLVTDGDDFYQYFIHSCDKSENPEPDKYKIPLSLLLDNTSYLDKMEFEKKRKVVLKNGQVVKIKPTAFENTITFLQKMFKQNISIEEHIEAYVTSLVDVTESVDQETDKEKIKLWYTKISRTYVKKILNAITDVARFGPNLKHKTTCVKCGEPITIEVSTNPVYFFLTSSDETI